MQIQILRRTCDNPRCPHESDIDLTVPALKPEAEKALGNWIILTKEHVLVSGQPPQPLTKQACCDGCAVEILRSKGLDIPKLPIPHGPQEVAKPLPN